MARLIFDTFITSGPGFEVYNPSHSGMIIKRHSQVFDVDLTCDVEKQSQIFVSAFQPQYLEVQFMLTVGMVEIQAVA